MRRFVKWLALFFFGLILALLVCAILALSLPAFSPMRATLVSRLLTEAIDQPVHISGDVRIEPGLISRVHASGVDIPSLDMKDVSLARLDLLEVDLDLRALLRREVDLDNLVVDGLRIRLLQTSDGATSWREPETPAHSGPISAPGGEETDILGFLKERTFRFSNVGIEISNQNTGFEFDFAMNTLSLTQGDDATPVLTGHGAVNGQPVVVDGVFPDTGPFRLTSDIAGIALDYAGAPVAGAQGNAHSAELTLEIESIGSLLDLVKLQRVADGSGSFTSVVYYESGRIALDDIAAVIDMDAGLHADVQGAIKNLLAADGVALDIRTRHYPENAPPLPAQSFDELVLTDLSAQIAGGADRFSLKSIHIGTNAIEPSLASLGPLSIHDARRTPDGTLAVTGVRLLAGPEDAPYLDATGDIQDLLAFKDVNIAGIIKLPASLALGETIDDPTPFGDLIAQFSASDAPGHPSLESLSAKTENTDLWSLNSRLSAGDVMTLSDIDFQFATDIPDVKAFLAAMEVETSASGSLGFAASLRGKGRDFETMLSLATGGSDLTAVWRTTLTDGAPRLDGRIHSQLLDLDDIAGAIDAIIDLETSLNAKTKKTGESATEEEQSPPDAPVDQATIDTSPQAPAASLRPTPRPKVAQPGQALAETGAQIGPAPDDAQPDQTDQAPPTVEDFLNLPNLIAQSEVNIGVDLANISGQEGVTAIESELVVSDGQGHLGPLEMAYGSGRVSVYAGMDFIEAPDHVSVSGETSGWNFGTIMDAVGAGIPAAGILSAKFDLSGQYASLDAFTDTMTGSAHVSLTGGKIGTSLLELAGLGVLPWLFSKEAGQGYTRIICMEAPLAIKAGRVASNSIVAETESVQVVTKGYVDLKTERLSLRAEPRPVGKAHARSAWPVEISGRLSNPVIDVKPGTAPAKPRKGGGLFAPKPAAPTKRTPCRPDAKQTR